MRYYHDQIYVDGVGSGDTFGATVAQRIVSQPRKKTIKESVPFSNTTYDFSGINGEVYWQERTLKYIFELIAPTAEALEAKLRPFRSWIMNIQGKELRDTYMPGYHFVATFDSMDSDESEIEKATITVTFTAQPYIISDEPMVYSVSAATNANKKITINSHSAHRIRPTITVSGAGYMVALGDHYNVYNLPDLSELWIYPGENQFELFASNNATVTFEFHEEVF